MIARHVRATGLDAEQVAATLAEALQGDQLRLVIVFADCRIDPGVLARCMQHALPAPVVGCCTMGVVGAAPGDTAAAVGFYGDWLRVGIGLAPELAKSALARSRDAVRAAAAELGTTPEQLDPRRHVAVTLIDGLSGNEDAFCIAAAAAAAQIRMVGGSASADEKATQTFVWARGEALADAGLVVLLESQLPFEIVTSSHLLATSAKTVVTAASGRSISELDGRPAVDRLRELVAKLGAKLDEARPSEYTFARFVDGVPYVRSLRRLEGQSVRLASSVEPGHVLRVMRPGDLIGQTRADLDAVAQRVGGKLGALLAFSCIGRHWEAASRGLERQLAEVYAQYPTTGFQSFGEQTGMLLVNHTLTGLAIGTERSSDR